MIEADFSGMDRFDVWLKRKTDIPREDLQPLAERIATVVIEDNRKGVLDGVDKDDQSAPPLSYRGEGFGRTVTRSRGRKTALFGTTAKRFKGISDFRFKGLIRTNILTETRRRGRSVQGEILPNNNLSTSTYQELDGPRLAPRGEASRVISNFVAESPNFRPDGIDFAFSWLDVLSVKGVPFLHFHFDGTGRLPRYDLRGIRRWGRDEIRRSMQEWADWMLGK